MKLTVFLDQEQLKSIVRENMMATSLFKQIKEVKFDISRQLVNRLETEEVLVVNAEVVGER